MISSKHLNKEKCLNEGFLKNEYFVIQYSKNLICLTNGKKGVYKMKGEDLSVDWMSEGEINKVPCFYIKFSFLQNL